MILLCCAKSLQSCPTLCDPIDGSPRGSPVPGILQARTLEWVTISFSNAWKWKVKAKSLSLVRLLATPWTAAHQAPPSMGFLRQEYWSGVPLPSPTWYYDVIIKYILGIKDFWFYVYVVIYLNANCAVKEHRCISNEVMYVKSLKKIRPDKILVDLYHAFWAIRFLII